ncbi:hypothetical protein BHE74_00042105 [Ensete ventricosum]|nr:hypothetical protein BHE74_00042105 [Ensete ventricosum]
MEEKPFPAWSRSVEHCLKEHNVKLGKGLASFEAEKRREMYGWNELKKEKGKPLWHLIVRQFDDMLIKILLVAAFISFVLAYLEGNESGHTELEVYVEPLVIFSILIINAVVGVWQETNAEKALEALKSMQCEYAKVQRDGRYIPDLPARELVPGDIVELRVGDKVPADMRVATLTTASFRVEQSSLTGESMPVIKGTSPVLLDDCELQAKDCMLFAGTTVVNGSCILTLAVAAIPEGLPAVITTCLALGTRKMAQKHAIVRKLRSVETLGCTTVICSDKTGTLTTNQMSVNEFFTVGEKLSTIRVFHVDGTTYNPKDGGISGWCNRNMDESLQALAEICAICNDAAIYRDGYLFRATGLPTEAALKVHAIYKLTLHLSYKHVPFYIDYTVK